MSVALDRNTKIFIGLGIILFLLVLREAILIPLTHDEYSTIMVSYQSLWDIITYKDPIPNNHILNTLLLKLNIVTFGDQLFTNRIHNVLSFIPYFVFTVLLAKRLTNSMLLQSALVCMMTLQPFLLDFFSVTRGYGLSVCFQVISIYYAVSYIQDIKSKFYFKSIVFGAIAVLANFTLLNYFLPLIAITFFFSFKNHFDNQKRTFKLESSFSVVIVILLGLVCYLPFSKMVSTNQFVFWSSNNFYNDTIVPLLSSLKSGVFYFKWNEGIFSIVFLSLIGILFAISLIFSKEKLWKDKIFQFSLLILFITILYNNVQFYLINVPFLNARTSLFFIPLVALFIFSILNHLYINHLNSGKIISMVIILLCAQHFARGYNGRVNYEWYFNQNTYEVLDELMYEINSKNLTKPVLLDCHWFYHPSLTYHINQKYRGVIALVPYHKETNPKSEALFYYSEPGEADLLSENYTRIKEFSGTYSILWKKK
jgi:hypothetical protein